MAPDSRALALGTVGVTGLWALYAFRKRPENVKQPLPADGFEGTPKRGSGKQPLSTDIFKGRNGQPITRDEVQTHDNADDCWIIIHGKVYDVTKFLAEHPGGEKVILEYAGSDATDAFEDIGHSQRARDSMEKYLAPIPAETDI